MSSEVVCVAESFDKKCGCRKAGDGFAGEDGGNLGYLDDTCEENDGETDGEREGSFETEGVG